MSLQQLRYLLALDDLRHFGLAAKSCFVAQPTLTTQLKKLEEELGVLLFDRGVKPIRPTLLGEKVIAHARVILDDVEGLRNMLAEETASLAGTYKLGIIPTLAPYLLPLFIGPFAEKYPEVRLVVREMTSEAIMDG
ncbi:MAG: LysR family transcriptional regulator, partial [Bacteroidota bacterium]